MKLNRLILILAIAFIVAKFCGKQTDGFSIQAISSNRPHAPQFDTPSAHHEELKTALNQPYHYFGSGAQAFVFFSADGKYVIKFFKQRLFRPAWYLKCVPLKFKKKKLQLRHNKWQRDFFSYKVALEDLQEETGVIYAHLNKTTHLHTQLEIKDKLGIRHNIDLDAFDFIVQMQGEKVYDRINGLMKDGKIEEAKGAIASVFHLISTRALKGYHDRDPNIEMNCGFFGSRAIKMDVGRFIKDERMKTVEGHNGELIENTASFEKWINNKYPELISSYKELLEEALLK